MSGKLRIDALLVERGLAESRARAQALVRAGEVLVDDVPVDKPGTRVPADAAVRLRGRRSRYASRAGEKLEAALDAFGIDVSGRTVADLGASTGGFTDCLLRRGAARVYAVDVGRGQLAAALQRDPRVVVMDRTNARHLDALPEPVDLVTADLSFISLTLVLPAIARIARPGADVVLLVKPQFEAGPEGVGRGGRVRGPKVREAAIRRVLDAAAALGFAVLGRTPSPVAGARAGNVEELAHLRTPEESRP